MRYFPILLTFLLLFCTCNDTKDNNTTAGSNAGQSFPESDSAASAKIELLTGAMEYVSADINDLEKIKLSGRFALNFINYDSLLYQSYRPNHESDSLYVSQQFNITQKGVHNFIKINEPNLVYNIDSILSVKKYDGYTKNISIGVYEIQSFVFNDETFYVIYLQEEELPIRSYSRFVLLILYNNKLFILPSRQNDTNILHFGDISKNNTLQYIWWNPADNKANEVTLYDFNKENGFQLNKEAHIDLDAYTVNEFYVSSKGTSWPLNITERVEEIINKLGRK